MLASPGHAQPLQLGAESLPHRSSHAGTPAKGRLPGHRVHLGVFDVDLKGMRDGRMHTLYIGPPE